MLAITSRRTAIPVARNIVRTFFSIVPANERGIRLNFGKEGYLIEPGIRLCLPFYHDIVTIDIREQINEISTMQIISSDNVTFKIDTCVRYKVVDARKALLNVSYVNEAVIDICKMELRNILSSLTINEILQKKSEISIHVLQSMEKIEKQWGVDVVSVQIKDMEFDESMKKAMSTIAEATRQAEAKLINAKADIETAKQYSEAAKIYAENPMSVRLREFQLWNSVSKNPASTIYVVPSNLVDFLPKGQ